MHWSSSHVTSPAVSIVAQTTNIDRVVDMFRKMDVNGDGTLEKAEIAEGVHLLGVECKSFCPRLVYVPIPRKTL